MTTPNVLTIDIANKLLVTSPELSVELKKVEGKGRPVYSQETRRERTQAILRLAGLHNSTFIETGGPRDNDNINQRKCRAVGAAVRPSFRSAESIDS